MINILGLKDEELKPIEIADGIAGKILDLLNEEIDEMWKAGDVELLQILLSLLISLKSFEDHIHGVAPGLYKTFFDMAHECMMGTIAHYINKSGQSKEAAESDGGRP